MEFVESMDILFIFYYGHKPVLVLKVVEQSVFTLWSDKSLVQISSNLLFLTSIFIIILFSGSFLGLS